MTRSGLVALAGLALVALLTAACVGDGGSAEPTSTLTAVASTTPTTSVVPPSPIATPFVVAGMTLYPHDAWFPQGRSLCASFSMEAPYFGPEAFSIREEELPKLDPPGHQWDDVRACKDGITAIGYLSDDTVALLANGPHEWPVYPAAEQVSSGEVDGRPAVFVAFQQPFRFSNMVVVAEKFGVSVVAVTGTLEEARQIAEAIDRENITIPEGKDSFKGPLNGIRFYNDLHGDNRKEGCQWGPYGVEDPEADGVEIPVDTPLDIVPSYLPEGYSLYSKRGTTCGGPIDLVEAQYTAPGLVDFVILRFSGEAAWYSPYSEDWVAPETVDGHPAVFIAPPAWAAAANAVRNYPVQLVVKEDFGLTVIMGQISLEEAKLIAEGLNR